MGSMQVRVAGQEQVMPAREIRGSDRYLSVPRLSSSDPQLSTKKYDPHILGRRRPFILQSREEHLPPTVVGLPHVPQTTNLYTSLYYHNIFTSFTITIVTTNVYCCYYLAKMMFGLGTDTY